MKSFWVVCALAALVGGTAMGIGCGPQRAFCPDAAGGNCPEPDYNPDLGAKGGGGGSGESDAGSIFIDVGSSSTGAGGTGT